MIGALRSIRTAAGILLTTVLGVSISAAQTSPDTHSPPANPPEKASEPAPATPPKPVARPTEANGKSAEGGAAPARPQPASPQEGDKPAEGATTAPEHSPSSAAPEAGSPGAGEPPSEAGPPPPPQAGEKSETGAKLSPAATLQPIDMEAVASILGKKVRSAGDEDMGMVVDVLVGADGQPRAAVIDFGGFLGVGSRKVAVHWQALQFPVRDRAAPLVVNLDKADVQAAPEFKPTIQPPEVVAPAPSAKTDQPPASPASETPEPGADHAPALAQPQPQPQPPQPPANPPSSPAAAPTVSPDQNPAAAQPPSAHPPAAQTPAAPASSALPSTPKAHENGPEQRPQVIPPRPPSLPSPIPPAPDAGR